MKKTALFLMTGLLAVSILMTACDGSSSQASQAYSIASVDEAYAQWSKHDEAIVFIDVRTPEEYQAGHIPKAKNIPIQVLAEHLQDIAKDKSIYLYCESGVRASKAAELLVESGFKDVHNFEASMRGWRGASYPIER